MKDRRELLKGLVVGSVWATPVVSSVVLPVHAETTGCDGLVDVSIAFSGTTRVFWEIYVSVDGAEPVEFENSDGTAPLEVQHTLPQGTTEVWAYGSSGGTPTEKTITISCCNATLTETETAESSTVCASVDYSDDGVCSLTDTSDTCF